MKQYFTYRLFEPLGLLFLLGAFCWQTISNEYKSQQQQAYQSTIDNIIIHTADLVASTAYRDTANYKGEHRTTFDPESVEKATSSIYEDQQMLSALYDRYRTYYWYQIILYVLGTSLVVIGKSIQAIRKE